MLFLDKFTTNAAAPLTSPRTAEPGPGTGTITDPNNKVAISSNQLAIAAEANNSRGYFSATAANAAGRSYIATLAAQSGNNARVSFGTSFGNTAGGLIQSDNYLADGTGNIGAIVGVLSTGKLGLVRRGASAGSFFLYYDGTNWNLLWVAQTGTTGAWGMTLYMYANNTVNFDNLQVADMGAPWNTANGIATSVTASPGAGATATAEANAIVEFTFQAQTGVTKSLYVRRTDDDNTYRIDCDQANSKIFLYRRQSASDTEIGATGGVAQTFTNSLSYRIVVILTGTTIYVCSGTASSTDDLKITATSQTFNQTETGVKVSHAGTNLICWPRILSGAALAEVQRIYPF